MITQNITICGNTGEKELLALSTYIIWSYPQIYDNTDKSYIEIDLEHTRAADSIRINYDSGRDGWVIKQASIFQFDCDDKVCDQDWQEVAFIQAWDRDKREVEA